MIVHVIWMSSRHVSSDSTHTTHEVCSVSPNCSSFAMSGSYLSATPLIKVAQPYPSGSSPSVLSFSFATSKAGPTGSNSICQARGMARPRYTVPFMTVSRIGSQLSSSQMPPSSPSSITAALAGYARNGDVDNFRAYLRSETFLEAFNGLAPKRRQSVMRAHATAEAVCEAKARHPLAKPGPIHAKRAQKANWSDPVMRAKLADAYAVAGGDDETAARILGVSLGSARLAKKRHLDPAAKGRCQDAS